ncbi:MAG: hypothetical protein FJZ13_02855 [Candidatus Omnitrophica bacterium]|nr:hypothetical protein [Candidatus Omnitrophota bacterium]
MGMKDEVSIDRNKIFNIAIVIVSGLIAFNFIYKKQQQEVRALKDKKDTEIKKNEVLESISQLDRRIGAYKNLLVHKDTSSIINSITDIARESGVKLASIRPSQEQRSADYIESSFDMVLNSASYHPFGKFISRLESSRDVYVIDAIKITPVYEANELKAEVRVSNIIFAE